LQVPKAEGKEGRQDAGDAVALANTVAAMASSFKQHWKAQKLLLFYVGPGAGATFIGQKLNAICPQIQIMEYNNPEGVYIPTFLLS
jgi:SMODS-associated and fused to various effectors sensor domain